MKKIKILFLINSLKSRSGTERVAIELSNTLIEDNNDLDITIINRDTTIDNTAYPVRKNIKILPLGGSILSFIVQLQRNIKMESYNYIVIHNMGRLSLLCSLLDIPKDIKLISLEHIAFLSRARYIRVLSKILYSKIDQVVCLTKNDSEVFQEIHENVVTIPNFSSFPVMPNINKSFKKIVAIGRLTDQKNFIHLLQAWHKIFHELSEWRLDIYGDGEQKQELSAYMHNYDLKNAMIHAATSNIESVYRSANFLVMSSKYEGLPMVLIEAQSFGLPVVSYNCPHGPSEVITDGYNGFLVENQDVDSLAETILKLANDPTLLAELSQNSLVNAQKYQPEEILKLWKNQVFND